VPSRAWSTWGGWLAETLRYYPPIWLFPRRATAAVTLGGYRFPAGTQLFYSPYVIHHDPRFHHDPAGFDPDRWQSQPQSQSPPQATSCTAYLPFGAGVHGCPGGDFALSELILLIAAVGQRWHLRPDHDPAPVPRTVLAPSSAEVTAIPRATTARGRRPGSPSISSR
jgi:pentalenene oxygenase